MSSDCCPHYNTIDKDTFRQLIYDKLCDANSDLSPINLDTVNGVARAHASTHFKIGRREKAKAKKKRKKTATEEDEDGSRNAMLLHCETCSAIDNGQNPEQLDKIHHRAQLSKIGALCNNNLWICMHCAMVCDAEHARQHAEQSEECHMLLQCHDSHVYCATCSSYQYPRECGGNAESNEYMDSIVYEWLIVYGKLRLWWRSVDEEDKQPNGGTKKNSRSGKGGSSVFGKIFGRARRKNDTTSSSSSSTATTTSSGSGSPPLTSRGPTTRQALRRSRAPSPEVCVAPQQPTASVGGSSGGERAPPPPPTHTHHASHQLRGRVHDASVSVRRAPHLLSHQLCKTRRL